MHGRQPEYSPPVRRAAIVHGGRGTQARQHRHRPAFQAGHAAAGLRQAAVAGGGGTSSLAAAMQYGFAHRAGIAGMISPTLARFPPRKQNTMLLDGRLLAWSATRTMSWSLILLAAAAWPDGARAQSRLEARYLITFARITVGTASITAELNESDYTIAMSGRAGGLARFLANGEGSWNARGDLKSGRPEPKSFTSLITSEDDRQEITMSLRDGNVTELMVVPASANDSAQVPEADRAVVVDPLTAMLIPADTSGAGLSQDVCRRTVAVFDGRQRYELKLMFKRMDKASAKQGYAGPVVVCGLSYQPVSGHRGSNALVKYLSDGREMEVVLAPVAGTHILAPFGLSFGGTVASFVISADRFEAVAQPPSPSPLAEPKPH